MSEDHPQATSFPPAPASSAPQPPAPPPPRPAPKTNPPGRRSQANPEDAALHVLVPEGVPATAVIAFPCGLLGLALAPFGIVAIVCGVIALGRMRSRDQPLGAVRAWLGIIFGAMGVALWTAVLIIWLVVSADAR